MTAEVLAGLLAGIFLGLSYAVAGYLMNRRAELSPEKFMLWVAGGMAVRMFVALAVIAVVLVVAPVDTTVFLGSFLTLFVLGVISEIVVGYRR